MAQTSVITFKGKLDNIVGFKTAKGEYALRKREAPKNPRTPNQVAQRVRFLAATGLASLLDNHLAGLQRYAKQNKITRRNAFVKLNLAYQADGNDIIQANLDPYLRGVSSEIKAVINYNSLKLAHGEAINFTPTAQMIDNQTPTMLTFTSEGVNALLEGANLQAGPLVGMIALNESYAFSVLQNPGSSNSVGIKTPSGVSGEKLHVYVYRVLNTDATISTIYDSIFNGGNLEAIASMYSQLANANISESKYVGEFTVA